MSIIQQTKPHEHPGIGFGGDDRRSNQKPWRASINSQQENQEKEPKHGNIVVAWRHGRGYEIRIKPVTVCLCVSE